MVGPKAQSAAPGAWIEGRGWHQEKWTKSAGVTVNGYPYHDALSAASPNNPVVLFHASGHGLIANSKAMEMAGVSRETPDPIGGRIVRDVKGVPIGVFEENAMDLITQPFHSWQMKRSAAQKQTDLEKAVAGAAQTCLSFGITSFQDAGSSFWSWNNSNDWRKRGNCPFVCGGYDRATQRQRIFKT